MPASDHTDWPAGLAHTWVTRYNQFLFLTVALREFARKGWASGTLQDAVTDAAWDVVDAADHLRAHGHAPYRRVAGDEAALWARTVEYVGALPGRTPPAGAPLADLALWVAQVLEAWEPFAAFVARLPDDCFARVDALDPRALRPGGLAALIGPGRPHPAAQPVRQPDGEFADPLVALASS